LEGIADSWGSGFINGDAFIDIVYTDLKARNGRR